MKFQFPKYLKNKYTITGIIFVVYFFFLDDWDIFTLIRQQRKLNQLTEQNEGMAIQLKETKNILKKLKNTDFLEAYARSEKFFKKDDEEIFVVTYE